MRIIVTMMEIISSVTSNVTDMAHIAETRMAIKFWCTNVMAGSTNWLRML